MNTMAVAQEAGEGASNGNMGGDMSTNLSTSNANFHGKGTQGKGGKGKGGKGKGGKGRAVFWWGLCFVYIFFGRLLFKKKSKK
jgi:hypothetical protein